MATGSVVVAVAIAAVVAVAAVGCGRRAAPSAVLDLPLHPTATHPDAGDVDGSDAGPDSGVEPTCATGDGCDLGCTFLDADCDDGKQCAKDGVCVSGCFERDPDCTPLDDGVPCVFGEECQSDQCTFVVDAGSVCTHACDAGACGDGFDCVARPDEGTLCLPPPSCAAGGLGGALPSWICLTALRRGSRFAKRRFHGSFRASWR